MTAAWINGHFSLRGANFSGQVESEHPKSTTAWLQYSGIQMFIAFLLSGKSISVCQMVTLE